ncbi:hypothetical protein BGZ90_012425 [Linnemannia elongata]|nr:hypothetical protein BGZ90_012425 [Linnemannia elongata]
MDLRTSLPYLYPSDQSSSAKLQSEAPRRFTFDQHPSTIGPLTFAAKNSTLKSNNFQRSSQCASNMTTSPGNKTAGQTSRVASWIRLGQGSQFPSPSSTSSCSSSVSSPTYTQTSVLPLHLLKIPESAKAIALPRRSTLATALIRKPPVNPPELKGRRYSRGLRSFGYGDTIASFPDSAIMLPIVLSGYCRHERHHKRHHNVTITLYKQRSSRIIV